MQSYLHGYNNFLTFNDLIKNSYYHIYGNAVLLAYM